MGEAAEALLECAPEEQVKVMAWGCNSARNPSAVVMTRIKQIMEGRTSEHNSQLEDFIEKYGIDESAGHALRKLEPELRTEIMHGTDLSHARNPSALLISRI